MGAKARLLSNTALAATVASEAVHHAFDGFIDGLKPTSRKSE
jgi:hypothetical protein